jgi:hypothetical protein
MVFREHWCAFYTFERLTLFVVCTEAGEPMRLLRSFCDVTHSPSASVFIYSRETFGNNHILEKFGILTAAYNSFEHQSEHASICEEAWRYVSEAMITIECACLVAAGQESPP